MILVTGASGLLGTTLLQQLTLVGEQEKIIGLYQHTKPVFHHPNITYKQCDLLDIISLEEIFEQIDYVYHCAAIVSFDPRDSQNLIKNNINATTNIVTLCIEKNIKKLVFGSSIAAIGRDEVKDGELINENHHWQSSKNTSSYSKSKYYAEMEVWRGMAEGLNAAIVNPGIILGKGDWEKSSNKLFKTVAKGLKWKTTGITSWVDAEDVAKAMILLMKSPISNERFIISAGNYSYSYIFDLMAENFQVQKPNKNVPQQMSELLWRWENIKNKLFRTKPIITKETARTAYAQYHFDNAKFLKAFPDFQYKHMEKTIKECVDFYKQKYP